MSTIMIESLRDDVEHALVADGTYTQDRILVAAGLAADLVRYLNHATFDPPRSEQTLPHPAVTSSVIASIQSLTQRLEQLLVQLAEREEAHARNPDLHAYGDDEAPALVAGMVGLDLRNAAQSAAQLAAHLEQAHEGAARLSVPVTEDDES